MHSTKKAELLGRHYLVIGIVQGVGFRPFVYKLANSYGVKGDVRNTTRGVEINAFASEAALQRLESGIRSQAPGLSRIDKIQVVDIPIEINDSFRIIASISQEGEFQPIPADIAICQECKAEILDPANRRFHYAFNNCINCGPRFTIINDLPYDRYNTAMNSFVMCPDCQAEYDDPGNRRYHAQPTGCPKCGPELSLMRNGESPLTGEDALLTAVQAIRSGQIVAIKGLGGFHLACDARNSQAITRLREKKLRSQKPFALMAVNLERIEQQCTLNNAERQLLTSQRTPIVLLNKRQDCDLPDVIAPGQKTLGMMLPYTPLHVLLFDALSPDIPFLIMTSANRSEEPIICTEDSEDLKKLADLSDCLLTHNRPIKARVDDSVVQVLPGEIHPLIIRRARGYAPEPIVGEDAAFSLLAVGAELKNTFCLTRDQFAFLSQHIGDMENSETLSAFEESVSHYRHIFRIKPQAVACDLHPGYLSTRYAESFAEKEQVPLVRVQHHYAHIASVLGALNRFNEQPAIGLAFDGTGYGTDGTIWGGEALLCDRNGFQRLFYLEPFPLAGGDLAIRQPSRQALSILHHLHIPWDADLPPVSALQQENPKALQVLKFQLDQKINCVDTSSMGRLFDAVSALIGIRQRISYEGQAAVELENIAGNHPASGYPLSWSEEAIPLAPIFSAILRDYRDRIPIAVISARFHQSIVNLSLEICIKIRENRGENFPVVLSGGVWQNVKLLTGVRSILQKNNFEVLIPRQIPLNDGCIAYGQAVVADAVMKEQKYVSRHSG